MQKNKAIYLFSGIIALFIFVVFGVYCISTIQKERNTADIIEKDYNSISQQNEYLQSFIKIQLSIGNSSIGQKVDGNIRLTREDGKLFKLGEIDFKNYLLIFRMGEKHCSICVERALERVLSSGIDVPYQNVVILASYSNIRHIRYLKRINKIKWQIYNLDEPIRINAEEYNYPYFLLINKNYEVVHTFFPEKELPEYTKHFLDGVKNILYIKHENS